MPDQCMFCWHPAQDWPDAIGIGDIYDSLYREVPLFVPDSIRGLPFCEYHQNQCIANSRKVIRPDWWINFAESFRACYEEIETVHSDHHEDSGYWSLHERLDAIGKSVNCHRKATIDEDRFQEWFKTRIVDLARRADNGGAHRCANIECHHYVKDIGDQCPRCKKQEVNRSISESQKKRALAVLDIWRQTKP